MLELLSGSLLGGALGMRHALEPDHLAAVSTLLTEERSPARGAMLGAMWGLGHCLSLLMLGGTLAVLQTQLPARLGDVLELGVAVLLLTLGLRAVWQAHQQVQRGPQSRHHHGDTTHVHSGPASHLHLYRFTFATRPLLVGLCHGLAGSGALTALVLANLPSTTARLAYIAVFGLGSVVGMATLSGLLGLPLSRLGQKHKTLRALSGSVGALSAAYAVYYGYPLLLRLLS